MTEIRLKAYYQYNGPCNADPIRTPLSDDDALRNLKLLESDFTHALSEKASIVVKGVDEDRKEVVLHIKADCTHDELIRVIKEVLAKADLYGEIL